MIKRDFRHQGGKEKAQRREAESRGPEMRWEWGGRA